MRYFVSERQCMNRKDDDVCDNAAKRGLCGDGDGEKNLKYY